MTASSCSLPDCARPHFGKGFCNTHYQRWRKHGDPTVVRPTVRPAEERFWQKVDRTATCWLWTGTCMTGRAPGDGDYGIFIAKVRRVPAHRYSYELHKGPIPDGLVIDHLCRTPRCVNPDHLEAVTNRENVVVRGQGRVADAARATHCKNGHPWDEANTARRADDGTRKCRTCARERMARRRTT